MNKTYRFLANDARGAETDWALPMPRGQNVVRQGTQACLTLKVIYNNDWIQSSAGGSAALGKQRAIEVVNEAENIYNAKYASSNQLGTAVAFTLVGNGRVFEIRRHANFIYRDPFYFY